MLACKDAYVFGNLTLTASRAFSPDCCLGHRIAGAQSAEQSAAFILPSLSHLNSMLRAHLLTAIASDTFMIIIHGRLLPSVFKIHGLARHRTMLRTYAALNALRGIYVRTSCN